MALTYVFGDESGNFHFTPGAHASRYFLVCTVAMTDCRPAETTLLELRRKLIWDRLPVGECFHASEDKQEVRNAVFAALRDIPFTVQATLLEKHKSQPQLRITRGRFYHYAWFYHWIYVAPKVLPKGAQALITTAKIESGKKQAYFTHAVNDSLAQTTGADWYTHFCQSANDPCLQIVDYCAWAIYKKWESAHKELRPYQEIAHKITHEADMFRKGAKLYY